MTAGATCQGERLLAVFAHPDDESITCGGLLAACAARGARVTVLCLTRGEHGPSSTGTTDAPGHGSLAGRRTREIQAAARALGLAEVILADFEDGMLPWTDHEALDAEIRRAVMGERPGVVVTFGADGLYWHPDHIAVHERVLAVVEGLGPGGPAVYGATVPPGAMRAVFDRACGRATAAGQPAPRQILGITEPDAFGAHAAAPTLVADVRAHAPAKLAALRCHASQLEQDALVWLTDEDAGLLGTEHFHRLGDRAGFIEQLTW